MKSPRPYLFATLASFICLFLAGSAFADTYTFRTYQEHKVDKDFKLRVSNTAGSITVEQSNNDLLVIDAEKKVRAKNKEEAERLESKIEINVEAAPGHVSIETDYPRWNEGDSFWEKLFDIRKDNYGYVDYTVKVPVDVKLEISSTSGEVEVLDQKGEVSISLTSGDVKIDGCSAEVDISTTSGNIDMSNIDGNVSIRSTSSDALLENVTGHVSLKSTSGDTEFYNVTGDLDINKTSGDTRIVGISGDCRVNSTSGDIEVKQDAGSLRIVSSSGNVNAKTELSEGRQYAVETISGSIDFIVPLGTDGSLTVESVSGSIDTELPMTVRSMSEHSLSGEIGSGGPRINLSTSSGDITLSER